MNTSFRIAGLVAATLSMCMAGCDSLGGLPGFTRTFPRTAAWRQIDVNRGGNALPTVTAVADFNSDGLPDVVVGYPGSQNANAEIAIMFQIAPTQWRRVPILSGSGATGVVSLAVADVSGDGRPDIIAGCDGRIVYLRSPDNPDSGLGWGADVIAQSDGAGLGRWTDVVVVQIDRLFGVDIVACNSQGGLLSWFRAPQFPLTGAGWQRIDIDNTTRSGATGIAVTDLDRDGFPDVFSTARGESQASVAWYRHPGNNINQAAAWQKFTIGNINDPTRVDVGDLNRDGRTDVVVVSPAELLIGWYAQPDNLTTGTWSGVILAEFVSNMPTDARVADVDANGQPDVVAATANSGTLRWFTPVNDVRGAWVENNLIDLDTNVGRISLADIDRNGRIDAVAPLVAADAANDLVAWFQNPEL